MGFPGRSAARQSITRLLYSGLAVTLTIVLLLVIALVLAVSGGNLGSDAFVGVLVGISVVFALLTASNARLTRLVRQPLSVIDTVISAVDAGDRSRRVPSLQVEEYDRLGQGINRMLDSLVASNAAMELERRRTVAIIESASDGVVVVDAQGCVTEINPAAARMFEMDPEETIGRPAVDLGLFADHEIARGVELLQPGSGQPVVRRYGERVLSVSVSALTVDDSTSDQRGSVWVLRDVTELIRIDELKNEFISIVSHELRTPLTSIKGFTDLILEGEVGEITDEQREFLTIVQSNSDRLVALINDMLDISRIESGRIQLMLEEIDLAETLDRAVTALRPLIDDKQLRYQQELAPSAPAVVADEARLLQILTNLLSNACKYTPEGGWITVRAEALDGQVAVSVSDTGIGIPPESLPQVFSKFYRVDRGAAREISGTGLGLAITKSLVELHGGRITIASRVGMGTTVRFTLPTSDLQLSVSALGDDGLPVVMLAVRDTAEREGWAREIGRLPASIVYPPALTAAAIADDAAQQHVSIVVARCGGDDCDLPRLEDLLAELRRRTAVAATPVVAVTAGLMTDVSSERATILPASAGAAAIADAVRDALPDVTRAAPRRGRVLVAEDDPDVAGFLRRILAVAGFEVTLVRDGLAAVVRAIEILPDLIVLDVNMPRMGASEVLPQLQSNPGTRDIPVVIISGTVPDSRPYFIEAGAADFFAKPFDGEQLVQRLIDLGGRPNRGAGRGR